MSVMLSTYPANRTDEFQELQAKTLLKDEYLRVLNIADDWASNQRWRQMLWKLKNQIPDGLPTWVRQELVQHNLSEK